MITVLFYLLFFFETIHGHLCLIDPTQRGGLPTQLVPGDLACASSTNCGHEAPGRAQGEFNKGSQIALTYQKNLELFNEDDPGVFQIWFAPSRHANFHLLGMYPDEKSDSLTNYTRTVTLPQTASEESVLMVQYDPHRKDGIIFYQCADVKILDESGDICLPETYTAHVEVLRDETSIHGHHHDEYREGDFLQIWVDKNAQMSLVKSFGMEQSERREDEHFFFTLRDYNKKLQWKGYYDRTTQKVTRCNLSLHPNAWEPYCLAHSVSLESSGTIGENNKVDYYTAVYEDDVKYVFENISITIEKGSLSKPIAEEVKGTRFDNETQVESRWMEYREWYDMSEAKIDPSIFQIPDECPH